MQLLAFRFAFAGNILIVVFLISVTFGITPLKVTDLAWLTGFPVVILDNTLFALIGLCFISLSTYFDPSNSSLVSHQRRLAKLCFPVILGFFLFIPLQFFVAHRTVATIKKQELYQYETSARRIKFLAQKIDQSQTFDQLQNVMKAYQAFQIPESERSKPLQYLKSLLLRKTDEALVLLKSRRRPDLVTASSWEAYRSAIRNSLYSFAYLFAFSVFAQRRQSDQSWLQELMDGLLDRLYGLLQHRETRLATEILEKREDQPGSIPLSSQQLSSLHQQGLLDQAWIADHDNQDGNLHPSPNDDRFDSGLDSDSSLRSSARPPGMFSWFRSAERRRRDQPTSFLQSLADHQDSDLNSGTDCQITDPNLLPKDQLSLDKEQQDPAQQIPAPPTQRRQRITDLDYFEQLAQDDQHEPGTESQHPRSSPKA